MSDMQFFYLTAQNTIYMYVCYCILNVSKR